MPVPRIQIVRRPDSRTATHPDLFLERYDALLVVARRLVGDDRMLAEDLVHDAYVQFVLSQPDLARIEHLDAYLAGRRYLESGTTFGTYVFPGAPRTLLVSAAVTRR